VSHISGRGLARALVAWVGEKEIKTFASFPNSTNPSRRGPMRQTDTLSFAQLLSYGLLTMPVAMAGLTLLTFLPTYYAVDLGLGLSVVGIVFAAGRILDFITDPVIGHWSDQTRTRFGPRKPWMAGGVIGRCCGA
jgi:MFS family permease